MQIICYNGIMLTIVCGEDTTASRNHYQKLKKHYASNGYEVVQVPKADLETIRSVTTETESLFSPKRAFFSEHLVKFLKKSKNKATLQEIQDIMKRDIHWYDWEQYQAREITNPKGATIKEFKPPHSIFQLLEICVPGNREQFLLLTAQLVQTVEEGFIYTMLWKHVRNLLIVKSGVPNSVVPAWQKFKLTAQAQRWPQEKLVGFYEGLARIDMTIKTSANPYGIKKSLDILACYYL